jgi:hypothetical protein
MSTYILNNQDDCYLFYNKIVETIFENIRCNDFQKINICLWPTGPRAYNESDFDGIYISLDNENMFAVYKTKISCATNYDKYFSIVQEALKTWPICNKEMKIIFASNKGTL